jgi:hypothetical protein
LFVVIVVIGGIGATVVAARRVGGTGRTPGSGG